MAKPKNSNSSTSYKEFEEKVNNLKEIINNRGPHAEEFERELCQNLGITYRKDRVHLREIVRTDEDYLKIISKLLRKNKYINKNPLSVPRKESENAIENKSDSSSDKGPCSLRLKSDDIKYLKDVVGGGSASVGVEELIRIHKNIVDKNSTDKVLKEFATIAEQITSIEHHISADEKERLWKSFQEKKNEYFKDQISSVQKNLENILKKI